MLCYTNKICIFVRTISKLNFMDAKLTIKLDKNVIEQAKSYANSNNRSLSRLIESYLQSLVSKDKTIDNKEITISPFVKSMQTGVKIPVELDYKKDYSNFLTEKHK